MIIKLFLIVFVIVAIAVLICMLINRANAKVEAEAFFDMMDKIGKLK